MDSGHALESTTTFLEWKVTGLKKLFESSKGDAKSKVTRSVKFGGGKWQILFYPNSGTDGGAHLSLYLSCEPTAEEKEKASLDGKWVREGKYKFNFELCTIGKSTSFNRKEACDHSFNYKTANWGWAQFARRDSVYYSSSIVRQADAFLIHCEITASPASPSRSPEAPVQTVPKSLMLSIGDLLNNPLYSDVEFVFPPRRRNQSTRKIWAMKALLRRADYFSSLLDSGFAEGMNLVEDREEADISDQDETQTVHFLLQSPLYSYDSDFDDESDEEVDEDSVDGAESAPSEVQTEIVETIEGSTVAPSVTEQDQNSTGSGEAFETAKGVEDGADETAAGATPTLTTNWSSVNISDSNLASDISIISRPQSQEQTIDPAQPVQPLPGPPKVRIEVKDVAYRTYLSMLHYLYTDNVYFAPLTSNFLKETDNRAPVVAPMTPVPASGSSVIFESSATVVGLKSPAHKMQAAITSRKEWLRVWHTNNSNLQEVGPCSAKAMYQLADKLNLLELKSKAFRFIIKSMTVQNIPHEMFSSFSARFEEVRKVQVDYFLTHWETIRSSDSMANIWQQIRGGKHPGFEEVWPRIAMNLVFKPQTTPTEAQDTEAT